VANGSGPSEPHGGAHLATRLNWLRAGVLGANDGIVSTAAVVVGVAGATTSTGAIATAGVAAAVGGAISMALGEYVSVSSQRDSETAYIEKERRELQEDPKGELEELAGLLEKRGMSTDTARQAAAELTERDALGSHLAVELNVEMEAVVSPWHAAFASLVAFSIGAVLPILAILLPPVALRVPVTFAVTLLSLGLAGWIAAWIGGGSRLRAAVRVVVGGALALAVTFLVGVLFGTTGVAG
jgi:vacuolar iron transporter family protein